MAWFYTDPAKESDKWSLPDAEVFYRTVKENRADHWLDHEGKVLNTGWYVWACFSGCLPDGDPSGPYDTKQKAIDSWRRET